MGCVGSGGLGGFRSSAQDAYATDETESKVEDVGGLVNIKEMQDDGMDAISAIRNVISSWICDLKKRETKLENSYPRESSSKQDYLKLLKQVLL